MAMRFISLALISFFLVSPASATELFENWQSARALGMGNAYSAVVADKDALFYNPAGLSRIQGLHLTLLDPSIGTDAFDSYTLFKDVTSSDYASAITKFYGKQIWLGVSDSLAFSMPGFAVAGYTFTNISFNLHNPAYSNVTLNLTEDFGIIGGFGASLLPQNALQLGFAIKRVTRYGGRVPFGPSTLATLSNGELKGLLENYGSGYGLDAGINIELPIATSPTFSAVWQDIGQTKIIPTKGTRALPPLDNNAIAGFSMLFDWTLIKLRPVAEFRHINLKEEQLGKRIHVGFELSVLNVDIRAGANQGYYTAGVGLDLKYLRLDAATWGVELNTYPGQKEDRRYVVQATIDLNFDPNFGSGSSNGSSGTSRPRPYQRR